MRTRTRKKEQNNAKLWIIWVAIHGILPWYLLFTFFFLLFLSLFVAATKRSTTMRNAINNRQIKFHAMNGQNCLVSPFVWMQFSAFWKFILFSIFRLNCNDKITFSEAKKIHQNWRQTHLVEGDVFDRNYRRNIWKCLVDSALYF